MEREAGKVDGLDTHVMKNNTSELYDKKKKRISEGLPTLN